LEGKSGYWYPFSTAGSDPLGQYAVGLGVGFELHILFWGVQVWLWRVQDNHGGRGWLVTPAFRALVALSLSVNGGFFVNWMVETIDDLTGIGFEVGLELISVGVSASLSTVGRDYVCTNEGDMPTRFEGALTAAVAGAKEGFAFGLYVALGYSFLLRTNPYYKLEY
jgi:preprotein translocase subunit SecY